MKRVLKSSLSFILAFTMILSSAYVGLSEVGFSKIFSVEAKAASNGTCGNNVTWTLDDSGTLTISGTGAMTDYSSYYLIPWYSKRASITKIYINKGITNIGSYAFYNCSNLTSISVPDSVTSIGSYAFSGCTSFTAITIPDSVTSIGDSAFINTGYFNNEANWENDILYIGKYCVKVKETISGKCTIKPGTKIICDYAFYNCANLTSISVPDSVTSIGKYAFYYCKNLKSIAISDSVKNIGYAAFYYCTGLTNITIPDSITSIDSMVFCSCTSLESVIIPDSVLSIGSYAFNGCASLRSISIPDSVTAIEYQAFEKCNSLTSVKISENVTEIGACAFSECTNLTAINVDDNNPEYSSVNGVLFNKDKTNLIQYPTGKKNTYYEIPDGVTNIGLYAFKKCTNIISLTMPDSVINIDYSAFNDCENLTSIKLSDSLTSIGRYAFMGCLRLTSVTIPDSVTSLGDSAFDGCASLSYLKISDNLTFIDDGTFGGCTSLTSVIIPDSVTSIGSYAFNWCLNLTSITIPDTVTSIGEEAFSSTAYYDNYDNWVNDVLYIDKHLIKANEYISGSYAIETGTKSIATKAFYNCTGLTSVTIPNSITNIDEETFYNCTGLTSVTIPNSITNIDEETFYNCTSLRSISIPYGVRRIGDYAFEGCTSLSSITIADSVTNIGVTAFYNTAYWNNSSNWRSGVLYINNQLIGTKTYLSGSYTVKSGTKTIAAMAFNGCNVTSVTLPNSVVGIGDYAFCYCPNLTFVTIPDSVAYIGDYAFSGSSKLQTLVIPDSVVSIGDSIFQNCTGLKSVTLPKGITDLNWGTFLRCKSLTSVTIPDSVTNIDSSVFEGCESLASIEIPDSVTSIGPDAFKDCTSLTSIIIPDSVTSIEGYAFSNCQNLTSITIPDSVTSLGDCVFNNCPGIKYVFYEGSETDWADITADSENEAFGEGVLHYNCKEHIDSAEWNVVTASTCTIEGVRELKCSVCGLVFSREAMPLIDHIASGWVTDTDPTCTEKGSKHKECTVCKTILETAEISAKGHTAVTDKAFAPTCTETGLSEGSHCSVCNAVIVAQNVVSATGHTASDWITDTDPTCTEKGSKHKECTVCKTILETVGIPAKGHTAVTDKAVEPTCTQTGLTEGSHCSVCHRVLVVQNVVPATGHTASDWVIDTDPTCTEKGSKHKECTVCKTILETVGIPAKGHTAVTDKAVAPTCTETGLTEGSHCSVCHRVLVVQNVVSAKGHTESSWITDTDPTCTEKGSKHKECTVCGERTDVADIPIDSTNHTYTAWVTEKTQTCDSVGKRVKICVDCGDTVYELIPATGHTSSSWITDKKATVNAPGSKHKECTECGETLETAKIAQLKPGRTTVKATTTSTGVKITWSKVTGADKYTVYRKTGDGSYKAIKTVTGTSYTDTTAKSGTKYTYNVKARNEAGYGEYAKSGVTKLFLATPKVTVANASSGVTVKWNKITGAKGYYVYRKASGAKSWTKIATVKSGTTVSCTDKKATAGKKYYYTVKAYNGDYVSTTKASAIIERLKAPTIKSVTSGKSGVTVKWAKATGADGYYVYRKTGSGSYTKIATVKGNTKVTYLDKSAKKGKTYTYYVKAYSGKSVSTSSKTLKIKDKY